MYVNNEVVKESALPNFERRCRAAAASIGIGFDTTRKQPIFGTRPMDDNTTKNNYLSKIRSFVNYLLCNGKYDDSLLIFHPHCPTGVISVHEDAVVEFLHVVYGEDEKPAQSKDGTFIVDAEGEVVTCGKKWCNWNCPDNMDQFCSALRHIHKNSHGMIDRYVNQCVDCLKVYKEKGHGGCRIHPVPRYTRTGNVANSTKVKDTILTLKRNSAHIVLGACHLLPSEVRDIRDYAAAANDIWIMQIFTAFLMSIELFLRRCEYSSLTAENFNTEMFEMSDKDIIESLNISVKGKRKDTKERRETNETYACWRKLWISGDDVAIDLDLRRHLLAFLYAINWKGGFSSQVSTNLSSRLRRMEYTRRTLERKTW